MFQLIAKVLGGIKVWALWRPLKFFHGQTGKTVSWRTRDLHHEVQHTRDIFSGFAKSHNRNQAKHSHNGGYRLNKSTQVFLIVFTSKGNVWLSDVSHWRHTSQDADTLVSPTRILIYHCQGKSKRLYQRLNTHRAPWDLLHMVMPFCQRIDWPVGVSFIGYVLICYHHKHGCAE